MNWIKSLARDFSDFLQEQPVWSVIYFSAFYLGCTLSYSRAKSFWYDELFTYHMSRLPDWKTILAALQGGADLNPPPLYLLTRLSHSVFGTGEVATRMPSTLGFLVMLLCLYKALAPRTGRPIAFAMMFFPMVTGAYRWATEARAYGMILGFVGGAVLLWQRAGRGQTASWTSCLGLALCLTGAVTSQAFGVVAIGPFLLAEAVRFALTRQRRWRIWGALVLPFAGLASYVPLLGARNAISVDNPVFRPEWTSIAQFYHMVLDPAIFPLTLVLLFALWGRKSEKEDPAIAPGLSAEEIGLPIGFLLLPLAGVVVGMAVTKVFFDRYVLSAVIGMTMVLGLALSRLPKRGSAVFATVVFAGWIVSGLVVFPSDLPAQAAGSPDAGRPDQLEAIRPDLPLVVSNGLWFLPMTFYSKPPLLNRLTYLVDRPGAVEFTGSDVFEVGYPILKRWHAIPGQVVPYSEFLSREQPFLLYGPTAFSLDWVVRKLVADGAIVRVVQWRPEALVCEVTPPPKRR